MNFQFKRIHLAYNSSTLAQSNICKLEISTNIHFVNFVEASLVNGDTTHKSKLDNLKQICNGLIG